MSKLTAKQSRFITEYLIDLNATQAAIRAGYSAKTATLIGSENLRKPYLKEEIDKRCAEINKKSQDKMSFIINGLTEIAKNGDDQHRLKAFELLGRYMGAYSDKIEVTDNSPKVLNVTFEGVLPGDERIKDTGESETDTVPQ